MNQQFCDNWKIIGKIMGWMHSWASGYNADGQDIESDRRLSKVESLLTQQVGIFLAENNVEITGRYINDWPRQRPDCYICDFVVKIQGLEFSLYLILGSVVHWGLSYQTGETKDAGKHIQRAYLYVHEDFAEILANQLDYSCPWWTSEKIDGYYFQLN